MIYLFCSCMVLFSALIFLIPPSSPPLIRCVSPLFPWMLSSFSPLISPHYLLFLFSLLPSPPLPGTCSLNCVYSAQQLLFAIFGLRLLINLKNIFLPYFRCSNAVCCTVTKERASGDDKTEGRDERQPLQTGQSHPQRLPYARLLHTVTPHQITDRSN